VADYATATHPAEERDEHRFERIIGNSAALGSTSSTAKLVQEKNSSPSNLLSRRSSGMAAQLSLTLTGVVSGVSDTGALL